MTLQISEMSSTWRKNGFFSKKSQKISQFVRRKTLLGLNSSPLSSSKQNRGYALELCNSSSKAV